MRPFILKLRGQSGRFLTHATGSAFLDLLQKYHIILIASLFLSIVGARFVARCDVSLFQECYIEAARQMRAGQPLNPDLLHLYAYPPAMALFAMPLTSLSPQHSEAVWYLINVLAVCGVVVYAWRLAGGNMSALAGRDLFAFWLGMLVIFKYFLSPLENHQTDMVIAALLLLGCWQLHRGRELRGGVVLGLAACMKLTPLLFVPFLAFRGRWRAALAVLCVSISVNSVPDLLFRQANGDLYLADWYQRFLAASMQKGAGSWCQQKNELRCTNHSLAGLCGHYARYGLPASFEQMERMPGQLSPTTESQLKLAVNSAGMMLLAISALLMLRAASPRQSAEDWAVECSTVFALMLLLSPMSSRAHYVILILPCFIFCRRLAVRGSFWHYVLVAALLATGTLSARDLWGKHIGNLFLAWGVPTWFAIITLLGCWFSLRRSTAPAIELDAMSGAQHSPGLIAQGEKS